MKLQKTSFLHIIYCISRNGNPLYLKIKTCNFRDISIGRLIWVCFIFIFMIASIILSVFSCINKGSFETQVNYTYDGVAGISTIGILTGAAFMVFGLFISHPLFIKGTEEEKQEIISLATLIVVSQLILTFICFLDLLFPFNLAFCEDSSWIKIGLQSFTILFMVISDIHLLFHLFSISVTQI